jgi:hypothetical protein
MLLPLPMLLLLLLQVVQVHMEMMFDRKSTLSKRRQRSLLLRVARSEARPNRFNGENSSWYR